MDLDGSGRILDWSLGGGLGFGDLGRCRFWFLPGVYREYGFGELSPQWRKPPENPGPRPWCTDAAADILCFHPGVGLIGGSWVVISRAISRITRPITHIRGLITPLITTPEPPSRA